uniref:Myb/SANT-like DNA-binding domain-containing protein n=1 Tax=Anguilla anguilla TaxID=7936 RepID=A0A0E9TLR0_ANGAN
MDTDFDQPVCKKKKLWETVAERVTANLRSAGNQDVIVKAYECDLKWRNMLATYRKNAERAKRLGAQSVHWEFFQTMHSVLGKSRRRT